ncbi:MAG: FAD-dependent oxidoreductase [Kiritimatiellales bacterium]
MKHVDGTYLLQRNIPAEAGYDLVVAGGGPAGTAAAVCAGRLGLRVLLIEATGCLGGMGTAGLVSAWSDTADGERMIAGGFAAELINRLHQRGYLKPGIHPDRWAKDLHGGFGFNPEGLKLILDESCAEAGVEVRFFTHLIDADYEQGNVKGVIVNNIEGHRYIPAHTFIDGTGDAVLAKLCGVACREAGRDTPDIMAPTLCAIQAGIDTETFDMTVQQDAVFKAIADGFLSQNDRHIPGLFIHSDTTAIMNAGHLFGTDALNCRSLSDGMVQGRRFAEEYTRFFKKYLRGCENMRLMATGALLGIRESRRIRGEYELNYDDFIARRSFPDQICIYNKSVDIHVHDCSDEQWERYTKEFLQIDRLGKGEYYGLPYGILVPAGGWNNLWVAGRCNSSDIKMHGAIRDQPACFMMGEAAGAAAVQSIKTGQPACDLNTAMLVKTLRRQGGVLPQRQLIKTMTKN